MRQIVRDLRASMSLDVPQEPAHSLRETQRSYPRGLEKPKAFGYRDLKLLLPFVRPHWRDALVGGVIALGSTVVSLAVPLSFKYLTDEGILGAKREVLTRIAMVLVASFCVVSVGDFFRQIYFVRFQQSVTLELNRTLFDRLLRLPKAFFDASSTGYLMSRVSGDVFQLQGFVSTNLLDVMIKSLQLVCSLPLLFYLNWRLTILSLFVMPLFMGLSRLFSRRTRIVSRAALEKSAVLSRDLEEKVSGAALIKAFAAESRESEKLITTLKDAFDANRQRVTVNALFSMLSGLLNALGMGIVLWYGIRLIVEKRLSAGELLAFTASIGYLIGPARFFLNLNNAMQHGFAALERIFELLSLVPEDEHDDSKLKRLKFHGKVRVEGVSFSYGNQENALNDISFEIQPGSLVAVVGPSGAGKSTLINLIMSLYKPKSGRIYFDDIPSGELNLRCLRERIGIVSQEMLLFNDSVKNNIRYGRLDTSDEDVRRAAEIAGAHQFILQLPEGYDTPVGEKGVRLSVGQKQRLSIARAVIKDPDILIFDEATSALDSITETSVRAMVGTFSRGRTVFAIAHRLSTVILSDLILVLDKGRIVQRGTHEELFAQQGLYRELCETQLVALSPAVSV